VLPAGSNFTRLWGLTPRERLARIAGAHDMRFAAGAGGGPVIANLDYVFDPVWMGFIAARPEHVVTLAGVPVLANSDGLDRRLAVTLAMKERATLDEAEGLTIVAAETAGLEGAFIARLDDDTVAQVQKQSLPGFPLFRKLARLAVRSGIGAWGLMLLAFIVGLEACLRSTLWAGVALACAAVLFGVAAVRLRRCGLTWFLPHRPPGGAN
jgi:hypothetical protein